LGSRGFLGKSSAEIQVKPATTDSALYEPADAGVTAEFKSDVVEIIMYRGTVFEVMRMSGPGANTTLLHELARKVYSQIS
jgi:hypothetical protein